MTYDNIASDADIKTTIEALAKNGITAIVVENADEAKSAALKLIPPGAEVMNMTSITLNQTGIDKEITESGNYKSVQKELVKMDRATQGPEMQKLGAAPEYAIGSVHAITKDGKVLVASGTGSQLPAYAYGSAHVIWVVGAQKIVRNVDEGIKRIYDHIVPRESVRGRKAYNLPETWNTFPSKILIFNREATAGRINIIFVKEVLGF